MNYIDIIEKNIYNIDSKICGIIDDYTVLQNPQKVADYIIQFLRTYLEHIAARIYACENPDKKVPIRGKDKWYLLYEDMKYYIDVVGNYLLFFDDANMVPSLDNVLNAISTLPEGYNVKVLITVRDYAKDRVIKSVSKYFNYSIVEIEKFNDSDIKDVLQVNFGIKNPD